MIVEHTFVSVLESSALEQRTRELLQACGFAPDPAESAGLAFRRGAKSPAKARRTDEVPQAVRVEFDRGRVSFAASLTPRQRPLPEQREILLTLAAALQSFLTQTTDLDQTLLPWRALCERLNLSHRRRKRIQYIFAIALLALIATLAALLVYALNQPSAWR